MPFWQYTYSGVIYVIHMNVMIVSLSYKCHVLVHVRGMSGPCMNVIVRSIYECYCQVHVWMLLSGPCMNVIVRSMYECYCKVHVWMLLSGPCMNAIVRSMNECYCQVHVNNSTFSSSICFKSFFHTDCVHIFRARFLTHTIISVYRNMFICSQ